MIIYKVKDVNGMHELSLLNDDVLYKSYMFDTMEELNACLLLYDVEGINENIEKTSKMSDIDKENMIKSSKLTKHIMEDTASFDKYITEHSNE